MNYHLAARELIRRTNLTDPEPIKPYEDPSAFSPGHAHWMLLKIQNEGSWSDSKRGRWLGWAQAVLYAWGLSGFEEMKALNAACSCDDEGCPHYNTVHVHVTSSTE